MVLKEGDRQAMTINTIINSDCIEGMKQLPDKSVHCCVTSPPYYGLRDYGHDGQIGLEETPDAYVSKLVEVFREVKRVLRDDGIVFLNLGDSYMGSGGAHKDHHANPGISNSAIRSGVQRGVSCGISGKEPEGYLMNGCFSENLCDECRGGYQNHKSHNDYLHDPMQVVSPSLPNLKNTELQNDHSPTLDSFQKENHTLTSTQDLGSSQDHDDELQFSFQVSMPTESFLPLLGDCLQKDNSFFDQPTDQTFSSDAFHPEHKLGGSIKTSYCNQGSVLPSGEQAQNNQCTSGYCSRCGSYSNSLRTYIKPQSYKEFSLIPNSKLKPKDLIGIPWLVAFALRADGWYLRQDIIWHKPNPMPESVTDRCTKSHEYIFLLSKSQKYYYDQDAVKEEQLQESLERAKRGYNGNGDRGYPNGPQNHIKNYFNKTDEEISKINGRNKRSVWTVTTKPFSEAHFATFPEDLIAPCIKAGCQEDGIVLDPFMGAGTTAVVARKLNRNYIGYELNPDYIMIAERRIYNKIGLFV